MYLQRAYLISFVFTCKNGLFIVLNNKVIKIEISDNQKNNNNDKSQLMLFRKRNKRSENIWQRNLLFLLIYVSIGV